MLKIEFKTSTAAFCDPETGEKSKECMLDECAHIVKEISQLIFLGEDHGPIMDVNGNKIGEWFIN